MTATVGTIGEPPAGDDQVSDSAWAERKRARIGGLAMIRRDGRTAATGLLFWVGVSAALVSWSSLGTGSAAADPGLLGGAAPPWCRTVAAASACLSVVILAF